MHRLTLFLFVLYCFQIFLIFLSFFHTSFLLKYRLVAQLCAFLVLEKIKKLNVKNFVFYLSLLLLTCEIYSWQSFRYFSSIAIRSNNLNKKAFLMFSPLRALLYESAVKDMKLQRVIHYIMIFELLTQTIPISPIDRALTRFFVRTNKNITASPHV